MKRAISLFLVVVFMLCMAISVTAQDEIRVVLNGKVIEFDQPPVIISDRTMVPVRAIYEALGAEVEWDAQTRTASGTKDGVKVSFVIDEAFVTVNGSKKEIDAPACIAGNRTLVPVRALAEGFNTKVEWDGTNRIVFLYDNEYSEGEKKTATGQSVVCIKDADTAVSALDVSLSSDTITDFSAVNITKTGKNLLDVSKIQKGANTSEPIYNIADGIHTTALAAQVLIEQIKKGFPRN